MKKILLITWVGIMVILYSCYDDKGSYDYNSINELDISGWKEGGYSVIHKSDSLIIIPRTSEEDQHGNGPVILFSEDEGTEGRYEYEWEARLSDPEYMDVKGTILSKERELRYFVTLPPGSYYLYLRIKDKETGLKWSSFAVLMVRNVTDKGFLILGENEEGYVEMDMISLSKDTILLKGLLSGNGLPPLKHPLRVMYTGTADDNCHVWLSTEQGAYYLDPENFSGVPDRILNALVFTNYPVPEILIPLDMNARKFFTSLNYDRIIATKEYVFPVSLHMGGYFGDPVNRMSASSDEFFKPFPHIFCNAYYPNCWILYNETEHRFVSFGSTLFVTNCSNLKDGANDVFPWIQPEGRDCVYGENTMDIAGGSTYGNCMALMSDPNGFYVYKFYGFYGSYSKRGGYTIDMDEATGLKKGLMYAFASRRSLLLYAEGNILHAYDYQNQIHYSKDMEEKITFIKFDFFGDNYDELMVATYNEKEKGKVKRYLLGSDPNSFELKPLDNWSWKGLVKVKDIDYKE